MYGAPGTVRNHKDQAPIWPLPPSVPILVGRVIPAQNGGSNHSVVAHPVGVAGLDRGTIPECDLEVALKEDESH